MAEDESRFRRQPEPPSWGLLRDSATSSRMLDVSRPFAIPGTDVPLFAQVDADLPTVRQIAAEPHMAIVAEFVQSLHRDMQELALGAKMVANRSELHGLMWAPNLWGRNTLYAFIGRRVTLDPFMHAKEFAEDVVPIVRQLGWQPDDPRVAAFFLDGFARTMAEEIIHNDYPHGVTEAEEVEFHRRVDDLADLFRQSPHSAQLSAAIEAMGDPEVAEGLARAYDRLAEGVLDHGESAGTEPDQP